MYPISDYVYNLYMKQYRQIVDIAMQTKDETLHITDADILQNNFTIDRYCMSGNRIELGSAVAAELKMRLNNRDGKFDNVTFEGAELFVRVGIYKWDARRWEDAQVEYVPCGYFTIDEPPRKLTSISISALDRMVQFDKDFDKSEITFPTTIGQLLMKCCEKCNVPLHTQTTDLLFSAYTVNKCPDTEKLTYRQIIQWIGEISGTCAYIDWDGKLRLEWYHDTPTVIDKSVRYTSDLLEDDIELTGVRIVDDDKNVYLSGSDAYAFNIEGNELIQHNHQIIAASLYDRVGGLKYRPYNCTARCMPHVYPLDKISYVDKDGVPHSTIVTHYTFKLNGRTSISAKGQTATKNGYASMNPLTKREAAIIAAMKKELDNKITSREQSLLELNETISNSLGLRMTEMEQDNGSVIYYYYNGETLEDSNIIYTFREGGFAWTDVWAGDDTVWQYGFTKDGNAIYNALSTYKIQTEYLDAGCVTTEKLSVEYKQSVWDAVNNMGSEVTQAFIAADGYLLSEISDNYMSRLQTVSLIEQTSNSILLSVSSNYATQASLALYLQKTENNQVISMINASADVIRLNSNRLIINSTYFKLSANGAITATSGTIGGWQLNPQYFGKMGDKYGFFVMSYLSDSTDSIMYAMEKVGSTTKYPFDLKADGRLYVNKLYANGAQISGSTFTTCSFTQESAGKAVYINNMVQSKNLSTGDSTILDNGDLYLFISGNTYVSINYRDNRSYAKSWVQMHLGGIGIAGNWSMYPSGLYYITQGLYITTNSGHLEGTWYNGSGALITSDINAKHDIVDLDERYLQVFDLLRPRSFKYNDGQSGRTHTGFVVQEILEALDACGIDAKDFAAVAYDAERETWALRYDELIALCCAKIQQQSAEIIFIKNELVGIKNTLI